MPDSLFPARPHRRPHGASPPMQADRRLARSLEAPVKGRLLAAAVIVAAHATGCASPTGLPAFEDVQVGTRGQDDGGAFCADFALTAAQARTFFARATLVTPRELHDRY